MIGNQRIEFEYLIERHDRVFMSPTLSLNPVVEELSSLVYWNHIFHIARSNIRQDKVISISLPSVAPLTQSERAKAHYKFLRHHYKKSKKQERIDKWKEKHNT